MKVLEEKLKYKDKWLKVYQCKVLLDDGRIANWSYGRGDDAVSAVVLDDSNNIFLIREWRLPWRRKILTLPIGRIEGKSILYHLKKELGEEIGYFGKRVEKLATILLGHRMKVKIHIFLVREIFEYKIPKEKDEFIEVVRIPFKKAEKMFLEKGVETTADTIIGILLTKNKIFS